jgi:hypothetical protein
VPPASRPSFGEVEDPVGIGVKECLRAPRFPMERPLDVPNRTSGPKRFRPNSRAPGSLAVKPEWASRRCQRGMAGETRVISWPGRRLLGTKFVEPHPCTGSQDLRHNDRCSRRFILPHRSRGRGVDHRSGALHIVSTETLSSLPCRRACTSRNRPSAMSRGNACGAGGRSCASCGSRTGSDRGIA